MHYQGTIIAQGLFKNFKLSPRFLLTQQVFPNHFNILMYIECYLNVFHSKSQDFLHHDFRLAKLAKDDLFL